MRIERRKRDNDEIDITALIDVVFILLVFFMLAGAIEPTDVIAVAPPETVSEDRGDANELVILIDPGGLYAVDGEIVDREDVAVLVARSLAYDPGTLVQIKPDAEVKAVDVIALMEEIREAGATSVVLLTVGKGESGRP